MTDAQRLAWIARERERLLNLAPEDPTPITHDGLDTLLQVIEQMIIRIRSIEACDREEPTTESRADLASELIYDQVRAKVNICSVAVFASDLARVQLAAGNDPIDAADMIAKAWKRVTNELETMIVAMLYNTIEADESREDENQ